MRIAIVSQSSLNYIVLLFALFRMGCVAVPVNFRFSPAELERIVNGITIDLMVTDASGELLASQGVEKICFSDLFLDHCSGDPANQDLVLDEGKTVILTSGTTGEPKGVLLSMRNHFYSAWGANLNLKLCRGDRWYLVLPLFHVGGLAVLFRVFLAGASVALPAGGFNPEEILNGGITHVSMVHSQLTDFLTSVEKKNARIPETLRAVLAGGSFIPDAVLSRCIESGIPVYKTYGLTEMASQVTTTQKTVGMSEMASSGRLLKYREISIGLQNEIRVKGETLFEGYISNGEFWPPVTDRKGWFDTGDMGYLDRNGNLFVAGRKDNMFISGGENIFPEEIERALMNLKYVDDAVVIPVDHPKFGKRPVAFVVFGSGEAGSGELTAELKKNLPGFKIPDRFYRIEKPGDGFLKQRRSEFEYRVLTNTGLNEISD